MIILGIGFYGCLTIRKWFITIHSIVNDYTSKIML